MSSLVWPGKLLAEDDLRRHWTSQSEIVLGPKTIVTPLAIDFLRGHRIAIRRQEAIDTPVSITAGWGLATDRNLPLLAAAVKALANEGVRIATLDLKETDAIAWVKSIAARVANNNPPGAVVMTEHAGLAACVANKVRGIRAATVSQPSDIGPLKASLGPNLFAANPLGRTYFELRQILKLASASPPVSPVKELDDANR